MSGPSRGATGTVSSRLSAVKDLTRAMLRSAQAQAWQDLGELEAQRRAIIVRLFDPVPALHEWAVLAEGIRWVLEADREIMELGEAAMREAGEAIAGLERQRRAAALYGAVAHEG